MAKTFKGRNIDEFMRLRASAQAQLSQTVQKPEAVEKEPEKLLLEYAHSTKDLSQVFRIYNSGRITRSERQDDDTEGKLVETKASIYAIKRLVEEITGYKFELKVGKYELKVPVDEHVKVDIMCGDKPINYETCNAYHHSFNFDGLERLAGLFVER